MPLGDGAFAAGSLVDASQRDGEELVQRRKCAQVECVRLGSAQDEGQLLARGAAAKEERHHKRVWEPNLGAVHDAIAKALDHREEVMVGRIQRHLRKLLFQRHGAPSA